MAQSLRHLYRRAPQAALVAQILNTPEEVTREVISTTVNSTRRELLDQFANFEEDVFLVVNDPNVQKSAFDALRNGRKRQQQLSASSSSSSESWILLENEDQPGGELPSRQENSANLDQPGERLTNSNESEIDQPGLQPGLQPSLLEESRIFIDSLGNRLQAAFVWVYGFFNSSEPKQEAVNPYNPSINPNTSISRVNFNSIEPDSPQYVSLVLMYAMISIYLLAAKIYHPPLADTMTKKLATLFQ